MKVQGEIKLIYGGRNSGHKMNGDSYCKLNYYSIEGRRTIIKSWIEMYGEIIVQIVPKVSFGVS